MNQLRKKSISLLVITGALLFLCVFLLCPKPVTPVRFTSDINLAPTADQYDVSVDNAGAFSNSELGLYLCRPTAPSTSNVYTGTISTEELIEADSNDRFYPEFEALVRSNDEWKKIEYDENADFRVETDNPTNYSVRWYLKETAPAAVYGVRCIYKTNLVDYVETREAEFQILYTEDWTYINVTEKDTGARRIENFTGGEEKTLYLDVTFNDGAANPSLIESDHKLSTGATVGCLGNGDIVSTDTMQIVVKTVSGRVYDQENIWYEVDGNQGNRVWLRFKQELGNDIYLVQFTSNADNRIIGQFIIDNSNLNSGVNLSQFWVILMIFGGLLALGAASAYLVPLFIVKVNEARVYKENERIARMKNPEAYATKKKGSFKEAMKKLIYNLKTPVYKRKKETKEEEPVEEKEYTNRFTEMLQERQEKREYMREHNVTSEEMEKMKEAEAAAAADEENSFAALRDDDDDEIATFHAAQDEISTLETGAYVKDGTTFSQLDSMRTEKPQGDAGNQGNNNDGN